MGDFYLDDLWDISLIVCASMIFSMPFLGNLALIVIISENYKK